MKFKKILSLCLAFALTTALCGCGEKAKETKGDKNGEVSSVTPIKVVEGKGEQKGVYFVGDDSYISSELVIKNNGDMHSPADEQANTLRNEIVNAKDNIEITGNRYYISNNGKDTNDGTSPDKAWGSIKALSLHKSKIKAGDAVLFQRGGVYRGTFVAASGVTYAAYGEGPKPCIYGSTMNYAKADWRRTSLDGGKTVNPNLYALYVTTPDIGSIVFNHGEHWGTKIATSAFDLENDYEFYHDFTNSILYLYCSEGHPRDIFYDIEFLENTHIITVYGGTRDVTIDNLAIKYGGAHGISCSQGVYNINITNCEIAWIGGSIQSGETRWGNGIEFYGGVHDSNVKNNWIYQIYDAAMTHQYTLPAVDVAENLTYEKNLVEYASYSLEYFWRNVDRETSQPVDNEDNYMKNIQVIGNIMRFAGYGFGKQRNDPEIVGHICTRNILNRAYDYVMKDNIFDTSSNRLVGIAASNDKWLPKLEGNTYIQSKDAQIFTDWKTQVHAKGNAESDMKKFDSSAKVTIY